MLFETGFNSKNQWNFHSFHSFTLDQRIQHTCRMCSHTVLTEFVWAGAMCETGP